MHAEVNFSENFPKRKPLQFRTHARLWFQYFSTSADNVDLGHLDKLIARISRNWQSQVLPI